MAAAHYNGGGEFRPWPFETHAAEQGEGVLEHEAGYASGGGSVSRAFGRLANAGRNLEESVGRILRGAPDG